MEDYFVVNVVSMNQGKGEMMMADEKRLIDANSLIEDLELLAKHERGFQQSVILGVVHTVKARRTVDVVEVVRCRDCKVPHNRYTGCPNLNGLVTPPDFYCPFGERRDIRK